MVITHPADPKCISHGNQIFIQFWRMPSFKHFLKQSNLNQQQLITETDDFDAISLIKLL